MDNFRGIMGAVSFLSVIESLFRVFMYMAVIVVALKAVQALNIYINKNHK